MDLAQKPNSEIKQIERKKHMEEQQVLQERKLWNLPNSLRRSLRKHQIQGQRSCSSSSAAGADSTHNPLGQPNCRRRRIINCRWAAVLPWENTICGWRLLLLGRSSEIIGEPRRRCWCTQQTLSRRRWYQKLGHDLTGCSFSPLFFFLLQILLRHLLPFSSLRKSKKLVAASPLM